MTTAEQPSAPAELHSLRVDPELWRKGLEAARRKGTNRNAVLVRALEELVAADELERAWRDGLEQPTAPTTKEHRP